MASLNESDVADVAAADVAAACCCLVKAGPLVLVLAPVATSSEVASSVAMWSAVVEADVEVDVEDDDADADAVVEADAEFEADADAEVEADAVDAAAAVAILDHTPDTDAVADASEEDALHTNTGPATPAAVDADNTIPAAEEDAEDNATNAPEEEDAHRAEASAKDWEGTPDAADAAEERRRGRDSPTPAAPPAAARCTTVRSPIVPQRLPEVRRGEDAAPSRAASSHPSSSSPSTSRSPRSSYF